MSLLAALREAPAHRFAASKYTSLNGLLYLANGGLLIAWPGVVQAVLRDAPFQGHEAALVRVLGMALAVIGWLYVFGGRSGGRQVVAASVLDRLILVPLVLVPTALAGVFPHTMIAFAILDPALALGAWWLLAGEARKQSSAGR
ncbi:MAG: hypothetical protein AB1832_04245 [Pseudomonadota bacterium]